MIPINDLMQVTHPGYQVYSLGVDRTNPNIHLPVFLDYCKDMGNCFKTPHTMKNFYNNLGGMVQELTKKFAGVDEI